jgi:hypothetical protein
VAAMKTTRKAGVILQASGPPPQRTPHGCCNSTPYCSFSLGEMDRIELERARRTRSRERFGVTFLSLSLVVENCLTWGDVTRLGPAGSIVRLSENRWFTTTQESIWWLRIMAHTQTQTDTDRDSNTDTHCVSHRCKGTLIRRHLTATLHHKAVLIHTHKRVAAAT